MSEIGSSKQRPSEFERALATVKKAQTSGRELRVDKKGNLKVSGYFGSLFLRYKVGRMSGQRYQNYVSGERSVVRTQVLKKLEGLAKQSREAAVLDAFSGATISEGERRQIDEYLSAYMQRREDMRPLLGGERTFGEDVSEANRKATKRDDDIDRSESTNELFNLNALDFLQKSKISMFVREPAAPRNFVPGKSFADQLKNSTGQEKRALQIYAKNLQVHAFVNSPNPNPSEKIIDKTNFREDPGKFMLASQARAQFFDPAKDAGVDKVIARNETGAADHVDQSEKAAKDRKNELEITIYETYEDSTNRAIYSSPNKVWNKADFSVQAGKRVASELGRRERLGEGPVEEGVHDKAVDFLCFLRKAVQKKFTGKGELPEQFQAFFNENSAVSVPDSPTSPDRLLPSKKLARMAVNLCTGTAEVPEVANEEHRNRQEPAHLGFSDVVGVREIPTRSSEQRAMRFAVQNEEIVLSTKKQRREILGRDDERLEVPASKEEALDGVTEHYGTEDELPEDFEKFFPDGDPYAQFPARPNSGLGPEGASQDDEIVPLHGRSREQPVSSPEVLGTKWVNKQYASWSASQRR